MQVDQGLLPAAVEKQPGHIEHQQLRQCQQAAGHTRRDPAGDDVDADVPVFVQHQLRASKH
ncbi:hypothetical protein D3C80_2111000 [compost metagenome]